MVLDLFVALGAGYLIGSIPTAEIVARLRGTSIFVVGSGNMGAMNTARHLGWGFGAVVLLVDVGKGAAATAAGIWLAGTSGLAPAAPLVLALAAGLGAVVGHAWSLYARFRGGKALATMFGASLPLYPLGGAFGLVLLLGLALILRRVTLASVVALGLYPFAVLVTSLWQGAPRDVAVALFAGVVPVAAVSILKHLQGSRRTADAS